MSNHLEDLLLRDFDLPSLQKHISDLRHDCVLANRAVRDNEADTRYGLLVLLQDYFYALSNTKKEKEVNYVR